MLQCACWNHYNSTPKPPWLENVQKDAFSSWGASGRDALRLWRLTPTLRQGLRSTRKATMQMQNGQLRRIKAFATEAGVSVRTLHLYDRLGLLRPAAVSESGYRLYGDAEREHLEHILALRFVGFSLDQIKKLLAGSEWPLAAALSIQREVIARQKRRLESALTVIEEAQRALAADGSPDRRKILRTVMEVFKMQNDWHWTQEYYSEAAREKI